MGDIFFYLKTKKKTVHADEIYITNDYSWRSHIAV